MDNYENGVSVIVASYNPDYGKLLRTLGSILLQKNIQFEIVIADDGSKTDFFEEAGAFLKKYTSQYKCVKNKTNLGTVKNIENALKYCKYLYVKLISPGDLLADEFVLEKWHKALTDSGAMFSFGEVLYYDDFNNGNPNYIKNMAHPQVVSIYKKNNRRAIKNWYLLANDILLGAATMCNIIVLKKYINIISGKVKYAEDNIYRLMINDRILPLYFGEPVVLYEQGTGVSTNGNLKWAKLLKADWNAADKIILSNSPNNKFYKKFEMVRNARAGNSLFRKIYINFVIKEIGMSRIKVKRYAKTKPSPLMLKMCNDIVKIVK